MQIFLRFSLFPRGKHFDSLVRTTTQHGNPNSTAENCDFPPKSPAEKGSFLLTQIFFLHTPRKMGSAELATSAFEPEQSSTVNEALRVKCRFSPSKLVLCRPVGVVVADEPRVPIGKSYSYTDQLGKRGEDESARMCG